uniref:Chemosensory protein n=1 Tax=Corythucha ciliata TaxID=369451 RepID=A0A2S0M1C8_CORCT|nr:chemosensory protein [Corythucha ciliata]
MHSIVTIFLLASLAVSVILGAEVRYPTKYDNIELDSILGNERLYKQYFNCLMNKGKCTAEAKFLKETVPDALATGCSKCSQKQRNGMFKVMKFMIQKKRGDFNKLAAIYDPQGAYRNKFAAEAKKHGINL